MKYNIHRFENGTHEVHRSDGKILRRWALEWVSSNFTGWHMVTFGSMRAAENQLTAILKRNNKIETFEYLIKPKE
tara:strand:+ start:1132 stop:1356 length:225 start_codon:yes stop_codon:yes gene_type:complete